MQVLYWQATDSYLQCCIAQGPVVQKVDNPIHWINLYPVDRAIGFPNIYPLDSAIQRLNNRSLMFKIRPIGYLR